jgi:hypothetical protein
MTTSRLRRRLPFILVLPGLWLLAGSPARAATYYVDAATGDDANAGSSEGAAWATVTRAMGLTGGGGPRSGAAAGDTVLVKSGTYFFDTAPATSITPCYNPTNSGSPGRPITFRAYPGHSPVLDCRTYHSPDSQGSPVFGTSGRSHVVYDGFSVRPGEKKNVAVVRSDSVTLRNITIDHGPRAGSVGLGNYHCFYVQSSTLVTIRDSTCLNSYSGDSPADHNAGGVVNFSSRSLRVANNSFINVGNGLNDKEGGQDNVWEYNYVVAMPGGRCGQVTTQNGPGRCGQGLACSARRVTYRFNVCRGDGGAGGPAHVGLNLSVLASGAMDNRDYVIHNNTFYRVESAIRLVFPNPGVRIYNNVAVVTGTGSAPFMFRFGAAPPPEDRPPPDLVSERNCFQRLSGSPLTFNASENRRGAVESLAVWQSTRSSFHPGVAYDAALPSVEADPRFTGASPTPGSALDFRLQPDSPCRGIGNTQPDGAGTPLDAGAFATATTPGRP